jgi:hypothetical protein
MNLNMKKVQDIKKERLLTISLLKMQTFKMGAGKHPISKSIHLQYTLLNQQYR